MYTLKDFITISYSKEQIQMLKNERIKSQKYIANEILEALKLSCDTQAIVCGGAPRDWNRGEVANDIDIYFRSFLDGSALTEKINEIVKYVCSLQGWAYKKAVVRNTGHYDGAMQIRRVVNYTIEDENIQFLITEGAIFDKGKYSSYKDAILQNIDFGICRCYFENNVVWGTQAYKKDVDNKTLTLYTKNQTDSQLRHCVINHLPKMMRYFPNHKLVVNNN